jgi:Fe-S cluster assembly protein SufD
MNKIIKGDITLETTGDYEYILEDNAHLKLIQKYNKLDNQTITINLNGINSKVDYFLSTLTNKDQTFILNINHNNKNTVSNIINHGVVLNDSKLEITVNTKISKGNSKSLLNQESRIITMGKNNSIINPNMYIDEYDVEARHAATIGKFNQDNIFYLMTKGLTKEEANNILIEGFLKEII